jgi:Icc-related predicted phosphoesterase
MHMRILAIADTPERLLYDVFEPDEWRGRVDCVLSCGDLDREYLEFLVTELAVPLLYVPGNHDVAYRSHPPEGCDNLDGRVRVVRGLRMAGIGGSLRYNAGSDAYQYTEREMAWRLWRLSRRVRRASGVDIMVTHTAPLHDDPILDAPDPAHRGSAGFRRFIERFRPRYWLHGHNHLFDSRVPRISRIDQTVVINAYGHYLFDTDMPPPSVPITAAPTTLLRSS